MPWIRIWPSLLLFFFTSSVGFPVENIRVASASPAITQMIYFLNGQNQMIARSDYCKDPKSVIAKPSIGSAYNFNYELAKKLNVSTVISSKTSLVKFKQRLEQMNIELVELGARSFDGLVQNLRLVGKKLKVTGIDSKIKGLQERIQKIKKNHQGSFLFVHAVSMKNGRVQGLYVAGQVSIYSDLLNKVGLINISANLKNESHLMPLEKVMLKNPNYIFWQEKVGDLIESSKPLKQLSSKHIELLEEKFKLPGPYLVHLPIRIISLLENSMKGEK